MNSAARSITAIMAITLLSKPLGLLREMIMAAQFGAGPSMDAYNMALGIAGVLPLLLLGYLNATYIPEYTHIRLKEGEAESSRFFNLVITLMAVLSLLISVSCFTFAPRVVGFFAPGFAGETRAAAISIFRILIWLTPLNIIIIVLSSTFNARRKHILPVLAGTIINFTVIPSCLLLSPKIGIYSVVSGVCAGAVIQAVILWLPCAGVTGRFRPVLEVRNRHIIKTVRLAVPAVAASATWQILELVNRSISSGLPTGSVSTLEYSNKLLAICMPVFIVPLSTVFFSRASEFAATDDRKSTLSALWITIETGAAVAMPIIIITVFMRTEIVRMVYERGLFTPNDTAATAAVLQCLIFMLFMNAFESPLTYTLLAFQDMKNVVLRSAIKVCICAGASIVLARYFGVVGIVLGTLWGEVVAIAMLFLTLRYRWGPLGMSRSLSEGGKMLICAAICGFCLWGLRQMLPSADGTVIMDLLRFGVATLAGGAFFYGSALLLKVRSVENIYNLITDKLRQILTV